MENIPQEKILREITVIEKPIKAQYLETKDRAIIFGKKGCTIINPITNQEIKKINNNSYYPNLFSFSLRADKKKIALSHKKTVKIYDINTGKEEWSIVAKNAVEATFSPLEKAIFLIYTEYGKKNDNLPCIMPGIYGVSDNFILESETDHNRSTIIKHNYITNEQTKIYDGAFLYQDIALHPTKPIMCAGNPKKEFFLYSLDNLKSTTPQYKLKNSLAAKYYYSHDGSFIVAKGGDDIYIIDNNLTDLSSSFTCKNFRDKSFKSIALNADSTVLALLSEHKGGMYVIGYYDIATKKCMYSAQIEKVGPFCDPTDLSFSPDETELMIVLNDKCIIVPVPFEVSKKQAIFRYWILKNYQHNNPEIPDDVIQYIALYL
jgi:WD40 repeat protein